MIGLLIVISILWVLYWAYAYLQGWNKFSPIYISPTQCADCSENSGAVGVKAARKNNVSGAKDSTASKPNTAEQKTSKVVKSSAKPSDKTPTTPAVNKTAASKKVSAAPSSSKSKVVPLFKAPKEIDDLKKIKGVGVVMEKTLNDLGITTFAQLAEFKKAEVKMVTEALDESNSGFGDRITRDEWVSQAKTLARKAS